MPFKFSQICGKSLENGMNDTHAYEVVRNEMYFIPCKVGVVIVSMIHRLPSSSRIEEYIHTHKYCERQEAYCEHQGANSTCIWEK